MIYKIVYIQSQVTQYKRLISHLDYLASKELSPSQQKKRLEYLSKGMEWFTDQSPLYQAITTRVVTMGPNYNYPCVITECLHYKKDLNGDL